MAESRFEVRLVVGSAVGPRSSTWREFRGHNTNLTPAPHSSTNARLAVSTGSTNVRSSIGDETNPNRR